MCNRRLPLCAEFTFPCHYLEDTKAVGRPQSDFLVKPKNNSQLKLALSRESVNKKNGRVVKPRVRVSRAVLSVSTGSRTQLPKISGAAGTRVRRRTQSKTRGEDWTHQS